MRLESVLRPSPFDLVHSHDTVAVTGGAAAASLPSGTGDALPAASSSPQAIDHSAERLAPASAAASAPATTGSAPLPDGSASSSNANSKHFRGVERANTTLAKQWMARVIRSGKRIKLGMFATPEGAARAYDKRMLQQRHLCATNPLLLNFPDEVTRVLATIADERARGISDDEALLNVLDAPRAAASATSLVTPVATAGASSDGGGSSAAAVSGSDPVPAVAHASAVAAPTVSSAAVPEAPTIGSGFGDVGVTGLAIGAMATDQHDAASPGATGSGSSAAESKSAKLPAASASAALPGSRSLDDLGHPTLNAAAHARRIGQEHAVAVAQPLAAGAKTSAAAATAAGVTVPAQTLAAARRSAAALAAEVSAGRAALGEALVWMEHAQAAVAAFARHEDSQGSAGAAGMANSRAAAASQQKRHIADAALALQDAFGLLASASARHASATSIGSTVLAAVPEAGPR